MKAVQLTGHDGPDSLQVVEVDRPEPGPGQVLMRVTSIGLNRAELMATHGHYPTPELPAVIGMEAGGYIEEVGDEVEGWEIGDRITPAHGAFMEKKRGSYAEYILVDEADIIRAPEKVSDSQIGGLWLPFITAWHGLHHAAKLDDSKTVVVPAASSSVGLAAIQTCNLIGAHAVGYTTHKEKAPKIAEIANIDEDHIILAEEESLDQGLDRILGEGKNADVYFDPIGGKFMEDELRRLNRGGRIVVYGGLGGPGEILTGLIPMREARIFGYHLGMLYRDLNPKKRENTYQVLIRRFEQQELVPSKAATFKLEKAADALRQMAKNEHVGKLYLVP